jgi:hypothetical protein
MRTLTAVRDYFKNNVDALTIGDVLLHVITPEKVHLYSSLYEPFQQRDCLLEVCPSLRKFQFGAFHQIEPFIIFMQTCFLQTEAWAQIIRLVGNLSDEKITQFNDDGVTQKVTAKVSITRVADVQVPSPVILQPYRTFLEVDQPASKFIFRIQGKEGSPPTCALFEADGGQWELEAMGNISKWLKENVPEEVTILA